MLSDPEKNFKKRVRGTGGAQVNPTNQRKRHFDIKKRARTANNSRNKTSRSSVKEVINLDGKTRKKEGLNRGNTITHGPALIEKIDHKGKGTVNFDKRAGETWGGAKDR